MNNKLKNVLKEKGMTQRQLAYLTGITDRHVSRIIHKDSPGSLTWWRKTANVLGVELTDIIE